MEIVFRVDHEDLRSMCVRHQYYTRGTNDSYCRMFNRVGEEMDLKDLEAVATDICEHSDADRIYEETGYTPEDLSRLIASQIINECAFVVVK